MTPDIPVKVVEPVNWSEFLAGLQNHYAFRLEGDVPAEPAQFDPAQMQQALINLLKNAHESGSRPEDVCLSVRRAGDTIAIEVADRGSGMTEAASAKTICS